MTKKSRFLGKKIIKTMISATCLKLRAGDRDAQDKILELHADLIKTMAAACKGRIFDVQTLEAEATTAVLKAIHKIPLDRLASFVPYAKQIIRRDFTNLIRQNAPNTRQQYENDCEFEKMKLELINQNGFTTQDEVYDELKKSKNWRNTKLRNHRRNGLSKPVSLDQLRDRIGDDIDQSQNERSIRKTSDYASQKNGCVASLLSDIEKLQPDQQRIIRKLHLSSPPMKLTDVASTEEISPNEVKRIEISIPARCSVVRHSISGYFFFFVL